jgi:hypothetical protein
MTSRLLAALLIVLLMGAPAAAQQEKPVPKDSVRISIPGCSKGVVFTVMESPEHASRSSIPPGRRFRLAGPKALLNDIKNQEGGMIEVTGLIRKGQLDQSGVSLGGGVRLGPGPSPLGGVASNPNFNQIVLDVEGWRALAGTCPGR